MPGPIVSICIKISIHEPAFLNLRVLVIITNLISTLQSSLIVQFFYAIYWGHSAEKEITKVHDYYGVGLTDRSLYAFSGIVTTTGIGIMIEIEIGTMIEIMIEIVEEGAIGTEIETGIDID